MDLTEEEKRTVATLKRLAKKWPKSLHLFSWSGSLHVMKPGDGRSHSESSITIINIPNSGGDPDAYEEYEYK